MESTLKRVVLGFLCFLEQLHLSPTNHGTEAFSFCFRLRQSAAYYAFPFAPFRMLSPFSKSTEKPHCFGLRSWDWNRGNYQVWIPVWRLCFPLCYYILFKITTEIQLRRFFLLLMDVEIIVGITLWSQMLNFDSSRPDHKCVTPHPRKQDVFLL